MPITVGAQDIGTLIVDDDFQDQLPGEDTDSDKQFATIQGAIDRAENEGLSGALIKVRPGTYDEQVDVDVQVTIMATGGPTQTTVTQRGAGTGYTVRFNADRINFTGFTVVGPQEGTAVLADRTDEENFNSVERLQFSDNTVIASEGGIGFASTGDDLTDAEIRNNLFRVWEDEDDGVDAEPDSDEQANAYVVIRDGSGITFADNVLTDTTSRDPSASFGGQDDTIDRVIAVDNDGDGQIDGHLDDYSEPEADENVTMGRLRDPVVANWSDRVDSFGGVVTGQENDDDVEAQNLMIITSDDDTPDTNADDLTNEITDNRFLANVSDRDEDGVAARLLIGDSDGEFGNDNLMDTSGYEIDGNYFPNSRYALQQFADLGNDQNISEVLADNTFGEAVVADDPDENGVAGEDGMLPGIWADVQPAIGPGPLSATADPGPETVRVVRAGYYSNFTVGSGSGNVNAVDAVPGAVIDEWPDEKDPGVHVDGASDVRIEGFEIRDQKYGVLVDNGASDVELVDLDVHDNNNTGIQITGTSIATGYSTDNVSVIGGQVYDNGEHFYNNGDVVNDTENVDDGINATLAENVTVDGTEVFGNENDNIGFRSVQNGVVTGATIYDAGSGAVPLTAPNNDPADDGVQVNDFNPHSYYILINGTNFYANPHAGVNILSFTDLGLGTPIDDTYTIAGFNDPGFVVTYNNFEGQASDIHNHDPQGDLVEARLNWFGDGGGSPHTVNVHPTGNHPDTPMTQEANILNPDGSVVTGEASDTVVYDPYLTAPPSEVKFNASNTQQYGHDVLIEDVEKNSEGPQVVGFPGPTELSFDTTFSRVDDDDVADDAMIWAYDAAADQWVPPSELAEQRADSLDAIAVTGLNKTVSVPIEFAEDGGTPGAIQTKQVEPGFNLIASPGRLPAETAMAVENAGGIERVQNGVLEEPESQPRTTNGIERTFVYSDDPDNNDDDVSGSGPTLSPYTGYWVFANTGGTVAPRMTAGYRFPDEFRSLEYDDVQPGSGGGT